MYSGWLFEKVTWDDAMVEPWELRKPDPRPSKRLQKPRKVRDMR